MIRTRNLPTAARLLVCSLAVACCAGISDRANAQSTPGAIVPEGELPAAKRPATLKRPPPELSAPPARSTSTTRQIPAKSAATRQSTDRRSTSPQSVAQAEELPRTVVPRSPTAIMQPPASQEYIVSDDYEGYDPEAGYYADSTYGAGGGGYSRGPLWVRGEYLLWWVEGFRAPALVTTSPVGTPQADAGILGLPTTTTLFGDERLSDQHRHGVRLAAGAWFNAAETTGLEVSGFWTKTDNHDFFANSAAFPILARPFFNVEPGFEGPDAELIAFPGLFDGQISVQAESSLWGAEALFRQRMSQDCWCRVDGLLGARYARLDEQLFISDSRTVVGGGAGVAIGTVFQESDLFEAINQFYGGELGVAAEVRAYGFSIEGTLKLALGVNRSHVNIAGNSTATIPVPVGPPVVVNTPAGLLAQGTNIGTYTATDFAVIPEVGINLGYDITPRLRATVGYTFFYWTDTVRPGDQIDPNLNLSQLAPGGLVGIPRPQYNPVIDNVWVQGLNVGLDFRF
jgi:hypothetical protein